MMKVMAEFADYSNMGQFVSREEYRDRMNVLKVHCSTVGRSYDEIKKSLGLEVIIAKSEDEAQRKMKEAYDHLHVEPDSWIEKGSLEDYASKRLVGTPEQCVSQLEKWLEEDIDYLLVGWTMTVDDWALFAEKVIPAFQ